MTTELEIIEALRDTTLSPTQEELLNELERVLKSDALWPLPVREAAQEALGGGIHNPNGRDHKSIDRRVRHALKVWRNRYAMNPEQMIYAGEILAWAIKNGSAQATSSTHARAFIFANLERVVHDDRAHQGFVRRAGLIDVSSDLKELLHDAA